MEPLKKEEEEQKGKEGKEEKKEIVMEIESNWTQQIEKFDELDLKKELLRGIYGYGFEKPSPIQQKAILPLLKGKDTIAQAQSGTGKTGAFAIGILQMIDPEIDKCQSLIVCPTRELAEQITNVIENLGYFLKIKIRSFVGGTQVRHDVQTLKEGVQVVVATPGRITDLMKKEFLKLDALKLFILDEADEMLSRGFKSQIQEIFKFLPGDVQVGLFSATMPPEILEITKQFLRDPAKILVKKEELTLEGIRQYYIPIPEEKYKIDILIELYKNLEITQAIFYCNSRKRVEFVTAEMKKRDFTVASIHGEMKQEERNLIMKSFRTGQSRVLISTDLLARGIDVQQVGIVINFELPFSKESYLHRIGRSGRFGRKGVAINFVVPKEFSFLKEIQEFYATSINEIPQDLSQLFV